MKSFLTIAASLVKNFVYDSSYLDFKLFAFC